MTQTPLLSPRTLPAVPRYSLELARDEADVAAAQRLRRRVFTDELGARLAPRADGRDVDCFDAHCVHLIVREHETGQVVGTYRLLTPEGAVAAGGLYADTEFDLTAFADLRAGLVELGRACVHPDHRTGAVIGLVWSGIVRYLVDHGYSHVTGCASVGLADGGANAAGVWDVVRERHLSPTELRMRPWRPWVPASGPAEAPVLPPLLRGYLRLGAWVCGPPAHDPEFGTADLPMLLELARMHPRRLRLFLGG
jgi:putative hemolysin